MSRELLRRGLVVVRKASKFWRSANVQDYGLGVYWKWMGIGTLWGSCEVMDVIVAVFPLNRFTVSYGYVLLLEKFGKECWEFCILFMVNICTRGVLWDGEGLWKIYRGQYEAITGELNVVFRKQQHFRELWTKTGIFTSFGERMKWRYAPSRCLFPHANYGRSSILDV